MAKTTMPVPSLKTLSASINVARRLGVRNLLNVAMTAAGSVAESIAPTTNACGSGIPAPSARAAAINAAVINTPGPASNATPPREGRSLPKSVW